MDKLDNEPILTLKSSLTMEEIEENFKDFDYFKEFKKGIEEVLVFEKGNPAPGTIVHVRKLE